LFSPNFWPPPRVRLQMHHLWISGTICPMSCVMHLFALREVTR